MKLILRQKIWLSIVVLVNVCVWAFPSDVVKQVALDEQTMLGRYSRTHFYWIVFVAVISLIGVYIDSATGPAYKRRWFQVIAACVFGFPALLLADALLRRPEAMHYVKDSVVYHRPPNGAFQQTFVDKPKAYRTYSRAAPGYGTVDCQLHTDKRGFRNQTDLEIYDVVVLGDSFAEGSGVSDEHAWPRRLAEISGRSVYNLGMSGYDPFHELAALKEIGLSQRPKAVLCLLYEGNDFRSAKNDAKRQKPDFSARFGEYVKQSPVIQTLDTLFIETFGPIGAGRALSKSESVDWLPLAIPPGDRAKYYAFEPKQLRDLYESRDDFGKTLRWLNVRGQLAEMNAICNEAGATFAVVFAPTKAHVLLPLFADRVSGKAVRDFTAYQYKGRLPEPGEFMANLNQRFAAREEVVRDWCKSEAVAFLGLSEALRESIASGVQAYYTYDQHWSPDGHEIVAKGVDRFLSSVLPATPAPEATAASGGN